MSIEFATNRQWDGLARRLEKKNFEQRGISLSATAIAAAGNSHIVEIQSDKGGMLVTEGWRTAMKDEAAKLTRVERDAAILKEWPAEIQWQDPWTLDLIRFYRMGVGAYPYDCVNSKKYPDAVIYRENPDGTGGWLGSSSLEEIRPGVYKSVGEK